MGHLARKAGAELHGTVSSARRNVCLASHAVGECEPNPGPGSGRLGLLFAVWVTSFYVSVREIHGQFFFWEFQGSGLETSVNWAAAWFSGVVRVAKYGLLAIVLLFGQFSQKMKKLNFWYFCISV